MGAGGVVALKLVVDFRRRVQLLLQAVGPDQGGGAVHLVEIPNLPGNLEVRGVVVQLLGHQLFTEDALQLRGGHGLERGGVQEGGGLVGHVGPQIVPYPGHLVLRQIDLVGNFLLTHGFALLSDGAGQKKTPLSLAFSAGTEAIHTSAVPPGLASTTPSHCAPTRAGFGNGDPLRLA